jgi:hypothetical protein
MDFNLGGLSTEEVAQVFEGHPNSSKHPGLPLKVTIVNDKGELVLDTLIDYKSDIIQNVVVDNCHGDSMGDMQPAKVSQRLKEKKRRHKNVRFENSLDSTRVHDSSE